MSLLTQITDNQKKAINKSKQRLNMTTLNSLHYFVCTAVKPHPLCSTPQWRDGEVQRSSVWCVWMCVSECVYNLANRLTDRGRPLSEGPSNRSKLFICKKIKIHNSHTSHTSHTFLCPNSFLLFFFPVLVSSKCETSML